jgi:hypothetical protein
MKGRTVAVLGDGIACEPVQQLALVDDQCSDPESRHVLARHRQSRTILRLVEWGFAVHARGAQTSMIVSA